MGARRQECVAERRCAGQSGGREVTDRHRGAGGGGAHATGPVLWQQGQAPPSPKRRFLTDPMGGQHDKVDGRP